MKKIMPKIAAIPMIIKTILPINARMNPALAKVLEKEIKFTSSRRTRMIDGEPSTSRTNDFGS